MSEFHKPNNGTVDQNSAKISLKVIGVGGAGNNAVQLMINNLAQNENDINYVDFIVANTDAQALASNSCKNQIALGKETRGLGAGADPEIGEKRARESLRDIEAKLAGTDVVIIAAGFGGGTGTGAAPVIAEAARNSGALTIAIVTTPFLIEGKKRTRIALEGIEKLKTKVDSYIIVSNEKLLEYFGDVPVDDAFQYSNVNLKNIIFAIHDILYRVGRVNIDYADVRKVLDNCGLTLVGIGQASGKDRAVKAVTKAFENHLYSAEISGAEKFLINFQFDKSTSFREIQAAINKVSEILNKDTESEDEIIIGQETLDGVEDIFKVSVIAGNVYEKAKEVPAQANADVHSTSNDRVMVSPVHKEEVAPHPQSQPVNYSFEKEEVKEVPDFDVYKPVNTNKTEEIENILELEEDEAESYSDTNDSWF